MKSYEVICIFKADAGEERISSILSKVEEKIKAQKGEVEKIEKWGVRKLNISPNFNKKHKEGYYAAVFFKGASSIPGDVSAFLKVTEETIRYMVAVANPEVLPEEKAEEKVEISSSMIDEAKTA